VITDAGGTRVENGRLWAGGQLLLWKPQKQGGRKHFTIPVESSGKWQIRAAMAMTARSGEVAFYLDGQPAPMANRADAVDLHRPYRTLLRDIALMPVELKAGDHTLSLELTDSRTDAEVGIDLIWIQRR